MRCRPTASPTLELMKAEATPGQCVFCPQPSAHDVTCGAPECLQAYREVYFADLLDTRRAVRAARYGLFSVPHRWTWRPAGWLARRAA